MSYDSKNRRRFIKHAGLAGTIGVSSIAGCSGKKKQSSDGSGGGSTGGSGGGSSKPKVNITMAPEGFQGIVMDHIVKDTDILANEMDKEGYTANVQKSFEGAALFASGGPDFSTMSSLEATRLATQRDMNLAVNAKLAPMFMGWMVKNNGPFDPEKTGGIQASIDKLAQSKSAKVGIGSWAGGDIPAEAIALKQVYGHNFTEENNDFNVTTADYNAIPQLIANGTLAAGSSSPVHGGAPYLISDPPQVTKLFWTANVLTEAGVGLPMLNNWTCHQKFADENPGAVRALVQAWHKGMSWFFKKPYEIATGDPHHLEQLGVENKAQARYLIDWGIALKEDNEYPFVYKDIEVTDKYITQDKNFLSTANDLGFVPGGWEDRLTYRKVPQE